MPALEASVQIESRHAVFINRFAGGLHNDFLPFLEDMAKQLATQLRDNPPVTEWSRKRLNTQLKDVKSLMGAVFTEYNKDLFDDLKEFSAHEAVFEAQALEKVIESAAIEVTVASDVQAFAAVTSQPLIVGDTAVLLNPFIKDWEASQVRRVQNVVRSGFFQGQTIDQMVKSISGKNGVLDKKTRQSNRAVIRTAVNHVSSIARETTIEENDDITTGYEWVSTLDSRTSSQCKSLDGTEFLRKDKGKEFQPKPPIHINCRSTIAPILDKRFGLDDSDATRASKGAEGGQQVQADQTYYSWLKTQPDSFVKETLGESRAKLFLDGGLTSDEFSKLSVDKLFRPLTLKEMKAKDPISFGKAGLAAPKPKKPRVKTEPIKVVKNPSAPHQDKIIKPSEPNKIIDIQDVTRSTIKPPKTLKLNRQQQGEIEFYKGDGFYNMNNTLRDQPSFSASQIGLAESQRDRIDSIIDLSKTTSDHTFFRGIRDGELFDNAESLIGKELKNLTPQSTTFDKSVADKYAGLIGGFSANPGQSIVMRINVKKGSSALNLSDVTAINSAEREILLKANSKYVVKSVTDNGSHKIIEVDYIEGDD